MVSAATADVKDIRLVAIPAIILADELIDGVPSVFVFLGALRPRRRFRHHLPPEKAHQVWLARSGQHSTSDVEFRRAVVIEVMSIGAPRPTTHLDALAGARFLEGSISPISKQ